MNCTEIQLRISECLDSQGRLSEESHVEEHLRKCRECSRIYTDLKFIRETASELGSFEPPPSLWFAISSQLVTEGLVQEGKSNFWKRVFSWNLSSGLKPALAGAILALITIVGIAHLVRNPGRQPEPVSSESAVLVEVQQAESHYQRAIEALSEVSQKRLQSFSPELAQIFSDNLATMDYYVKQCQDAVRNNPDNPLAHRYLLVAYERKADLMKTIVNSDSQY